MLATAKIHILKQFTTKWSIIFSRRLLCLLLQRYTFWSNSQQRHKSIKSDIDCACYCKDTHFEAIHNTPKAITSSPILCLLLQRYTFWSNSQHVWVYMAVSVIVLATAKIHILKQFTTRCWTWCCTWDCACYCKDTHFEAIHNVLPDMPSGVPIVLATAKIHILKQFTTLDAVQRQQKPLCLLLQRYTFWSNSQHHPVWHKILKHCACYCKDTHFEAIHNILMSKNMVLSIVLATAKIHILKQFTTEIVSVRLFLWLCLLLQRYTFWSNSQLKTAFWSRI